MPLFALVRGRIILRTSPLRSSKKFATRYRFSHMSKNHSFGGCAAALLGATLITSSSQSAPYPPPGNSGSAFLLPAPLAYRGGAMGQAELLHHGVLGTSVGPHSLPRDFYTNIV